jgi:hypothetical protein
MITQFANEQKAAPPYKDLGVFIPSDPTVRYYFSNLEPLSFELRGRRA